MRREREGGLGRMMEKVDIFAFLGVLHYLIHTRGSSFLAGKCHRKQNFSFAIAALST